MAKQLIRPFRRRSGPSLLAGASRETDGPAKLQEDALEHALRLNRSPYLMRSLRDAPLPPGINELIRVAAQCPATTPKALARTGLDAALVQRIAALYLRVVLFCDGADAHRILGVAALASQEEMRQNWKWLMKWLHPDSNIDPTLSGLAARATDAWRQVSSRAPDDQSLAVLQSVPTPKIRPKKPRHVWLRRRLREE